MKHSIKKSGPHTPPAKRRRGRPSRAVRIQAEYRPMTPEEEQSLNDALRLVLASMVRRRMGMSKENENE